MKNKLVRRLASLQLRPAWFTSADVAEYGVAWSRWGELNSALRSHRQQRQLGRVVYPQPRQEREGNLPSALIVSRSMREAVESAAAAGSRVAAALIRAFDCRAYHVGNPFGTHFSVREKRGLISYCPRGREQRYGADGTSWLRDGRAEIKPAKFARQILRSPDRFTDPEYARFSALLGAHEAENELVWSVLESADDINAAYHTDNWGFTDRPSDIGGSHGYSCMWRCSVGEFYASIGAKCLAATQGDKFVLRAMLWDGVEMGSEKIAFVDRIYTAQIEVYEAAKSYIAGRGWWKKAAETAACREWVGPDGRTCSRALVWEAAGSFDGLDWYPYMDTFSSSDDDTFYTDKGGGQYTYCNTGGTREGEEENHDGEVCDVNGDWIDADEAVEVGGDYYHQDSDLIVYTHADEYALRSDCYEVELGGRLGTVFVHEDSVSRA